MFSKVTHNNGIKAYFNRKSFFIFFIIFILSIIASTGLVISNYLISTSTSPAQAALYDPTPPPSGDNVSGFAWNEKYGWMSFNSIDCDTNYNLAYDAGDSGGADCPAPGTPFFDYGVHIDPTTGTTSGYAWSSNLGWISFEEGPLPAGDSNPNTNPDYDFNSSCDNASDCDGVGDNCTACLNTTDEKLYGWAKILSLGDDGWIRFDDDNIGDSYDYGVSIDIDGSSGGNPGDFYGIAWNGNSDSTGAGWVSFNCADVQTCQGGSDAGEYCFTGDTCDSSICGGGDICGTSNYKVTVDLSSFNQNPSAINLDSPGITDMSFYCDYSVRTAWLDWDFDDDDGDSQAAYQIIFDNDSDPIDPLFDTGKCDVTNDRNSGSMDPYCVIVFGATHYPVHDSLLPINHLQYGVGPYYWWVKVWDDRGGESDWSDCTVDGVGGGDVSFTIYNNEFPDPYFSWTSREVSAEEPVLFEDKSQSYIGGLGDCIQGECTIEWKIGTATEMIISGSYNYASTTIITFSDTGDWSATSTITDSNGYACSTSTNSTANLPLPTWIETK